MWSAISTVTVIHVPPIAASGGMRPGRGAARRPGRRPTRRRRRCPSARSVVQQTPWTPGIGIAIRLRASPTAWRCRPAASFGVHGDALQVAVFGIAREHAGAVDDKRCAARRARGSPQRTRSLVSPRMRDAELTRNANLAGAGAAVADVTVLPTFWSRRPAAVAHGDAVDADRVAVQLQLAGDVHHLVEVTASDDPGRHRGGDVEVERDEVAGRERRSDSVAAVRGPPRVETVVRRRHELHAAVVDHVERSAKVWLATPARTPSGDQRCTEPCP